MTCLVLPGRTLLLVAGMPGAGKSTLLAALPPSPDVVVLDSDAFRAALLSTVRLPYGWLRPLVHLLHRLAVLRAAWSPVSTVVVHLPATAPGTRAAVARLAAATRRDAHLLWLDVDAEAAREGQQVRGRVVPEASFRGHADRAAATSVALRTRHPDGFRGVTVLDRQAARAGLRLRTGPVGPVTASSGTALSRAS
ncbi:AAA family ATPase [Pseudonocardia sp. GCM10023141]|uniref:AAA family ATPase n=1 Tax=Pseudonocardia sp. GCM10023141 TaxID=3252653 RepID=UPI00360625EB